jgi:hypothetical protein
MAEVLTTETMDGRKALVIVFDTPEECMVMENLCLTSMRDSEKLLNLKNVVNLALMDAGWI